jgi:hypothetical protein
MNAARPAGYSGTPPAILFEKSVCAVDDTWSGLKLVRRKELR